MKEQQVYLGRGILRSLSSLLLDGQGMPAENIWTTIEDFGINTEDLRKINPTYKELVEIYEAINVYRFSVRFLNELKNRF